jgi:hypothetical protein
MAQPAWLLLCTSPSSLSKLSSYSLVHRTLHNAVRPSARPTPRSPQQPPPPARVILRCSLLAPTRRVPHPCALAPCFSISHPRCRARCPPLLVLVVPSRASGRSPSSQGHPRARPVLVVLACCRSESSPTLKPESSSPGLFLPVCCKCMFQPLPPLMLQMYVSSV